MALTLKERRQIIEAYDTNLIPMIALAKQYGVTPRTIHRILNKANINTSKRKLLVSCTTCGNELLRTKGRIRKQLHHFCSEQCYYDYLKAGNGYPYIQNRHGQRLARSLVSKYITLGTNHIVHHENRNCLDNRIKNLKVFRNQGDHIRHHRGFDVEPLWDGSLIES